MRLIRFAVFPAIFLSIGSAFSLEVNRQVEVDFAKYNYNALCDIVGQYGKVADSAIIGERGGHRNSRKLATVSPNILRYKYTNGDVEIYYLEMPDKQLAVSYNFKGASILKAHLTSDSIRSITRFDGPFGNGEYTFGCDAMKIKFKFADEKTTQISVSSSFVD